MYSPIKLSFWPPPAVAPGAGLPGRLRQWAAQWQRKRQFDAHARQLAGPALVAAVLEHLAIRVEFDPAALRRLPSSGAFLALADQPGSLLHSLVVLHVLGQVRPELCAVLTESPSYARLADQLLELPTPATGHGGRGFRRLLQRLHSEVPLALFATAPGGAAYLPAAERLLTTLRLPVVPLSLNSAPAAPQAWWKQLPALLSAASSLPSALLSQRGTKVRVAIGPVVQPAALHGLPVAARLPYLRTQLATLASSAAPSPLRPASPPTDHTLLEADLAALPAKRRLVQCRQWEVYVAQAHELPHMLPEVSRLRELALPSAPAGWPEPLAEPGLPANCYRYLLLYDRRTRRLVGACRLGHGKRLLRQHGRRGFGLHAVCKLKRELRPLLRQSVELSQAFIRVEYQGQALPLGLVWEALAQYLHQRPHYRYLLGQANLSYHLLPLPLPALLAFVQQHCLADEVAAYVRPRKRVRHRAPAAAEPAAQFDREQVLQALLASPAPGGMGVPPRLRPYFSQQARLLGVHLDPAGSGALHGAVLLDTATLGDYTYRLAERSTLPAVH